MPVSTSSGWVRASSRASRITSRGSRERLGPRASRVAQNEQRRSQPSWILSHPRVAPARSRRSSAPTGSLSMRSQSRAQLEGHQCSVRSRAPHPVSDGACDAGDVGCGHHRHHAFQHLVVVSAQCGRATRHHEAGRRIVPVHAPHEATRLRVRLVCDRTGVDDAHIGVVPVGDRDSTVRLTRLAHAFAVVLVGLAAERVEVDPHDGAPRQNPATRKLSVLRQKYSVTDPADRLPRSTPRSARASGSPSDRSSSSKPAPRLDPDSLAVAPNT